MTKEKYITYLHEQNVPVDVEKLEKYNAIQFGNQFDHPVDNLPSNIRAIYFGQFFNQPLENLPSSIERIHFSNDSRFNHPVDFLPASLKAIHFGWNYNIPLNNLPQDLEILLVPYFYKHSMLNFPLNLKKILLPIKLPNRIWAKHWNEVSERYKDIVSMYNCYKFDLTIISECNSFVRINGCNQCIRS